MTLSPPPLSFFLCVCLFVFFPVYCGASFCLRGLPCGNSLLPRPLESSLSLPLSFSLFLPSFSLSSSVFFFPSCPRKEVERSSHACGRRRARHPLTLSGNDTEKLRTLLLSFRGAFPVHLHLPLSSSLYFHKHAHTHIHTHPLTHTHTHKRLYRREKTVERKHS